MMKHSGCAISARTSFGSSQVHCLLALVASEMPLSTGMTGAEDRPIGKCPQRVGVRADGEEQRVYILGLPVILQEHRAPRMTRRTASCPQQVAGTAAQSARERRR